MNDTSRYCPACGAVDDGTPRQFCTACGAPAPNLQRVSQGQLPGPEQPARPTYSTRVVTTTRLLSALCMLSGILAIARFDSSTSTGRTLIFASLLVAMCGQIFVYQAIKPDPQAWAGTALTLFWLGLTGLVLLWWVSLQ
jgi:hypothetical protein